MDRPDPNRFRNRKLAFSTERFLGVPSQAPTIENPSSTSAATDELSEDDVVFFGDDFAEPNNLPSTSSTSSPSTPSHKITNNNHHNHKGLGFGSSDAFGILAALPEKDESPNARNGTHFFHKASSVSLSSPSSSSSSRLIPAIPKPPPHHDRILSYSVKYPQSAPLNVPIFTPAMMKAARRRREFDDDDDDAALDDDDDVMLPPHEIVARNLARSPILSCSVLEGVGRTLKGRDLRQVRNTVLRQTGFLD